ncbi:MAG: glycosyltransferase [Bacteroidota bacterium]
MKIAINCINLNSAGGLSVALNFLHQIVQMDFKDRVFHVFAPSNEEYKKLNHPSLVMHYVSNGMRKHIARLYTDNYWLPKKIKSLDVDIVFSMGNFGIPVSNIKQALLFHWPYAIYFQEKELWRIMSKRDRLNRTIRRKVFQNRLKHINVIFPQTNVAAKRLKEHYPDLNSIIAIPNAYTASKIEKKNTQDFFERKEGNKYLLCLSRYYPHKNIEVLVDVAKIIKAKNLNYKIVITISADQHHKVNWIEKQIDLLGLEDILLNIGQVPFELVPSLYESVDALILPTLLESFSGTYVDAMFYGKTIFTSNKDFATEVCGKAAYYFDPLSAMNILETVNVAYSNKLELDQKIAIGEARVQSFPNWKQVAEKYLAELENLYYSK